MNDYRARLRDQLRAAADDHLNARKTPLATEDPRSPPSPRRRRHFVVGGLLAAALVIPAALAASGVIGGETKKGEFGDGSTFNVVTCQARAKGQACPLRLALPCASGWSVAMPKAGTQPPRLDVALRFQHDAPPQASRLASKRPPQGPSCCAARLLTGPLPSTSQTRSGPCNLTRPTCGSSPRSRATPRSALSPAAPTAVHSTPSSSRRWSPERNPAARHHLASASGCRSASGISVRRRRWPYDRLDRPRR